MIDAAVLSDARQSLGFLARNLKALLALDAALVEVASFDSSILEMRKTLEDLRGKCAEIEQAIADERAKAGQDCSAMVVAAVTRAAELTDEARATVTAAEQKAQEIVTAANSEITLLRAAANAELERKREEHRKVGNDVSALVEARAAVEADLTRLTEAATEKQAHLDRVHAHMAELKSRL